MIIIVMKVFSSSAEQIQLTADYDRYIELSSFFFFLDNLIISSHSYICDSSPTA